MERRGSLVVTRAPIQHLIFDLDSTLTDTLRMVALTRAELLMRVSTLPGLDASSLSTDFADHLRNDFHDPDLTATAPSLRAWRLNASARTLDALRMIEQDYDTLIRRESRLLPGVDRLFAFCAVKEIDVIVWTNKKLPFARRHVHDLGLIGRIDALYARQTAIECRYDICARDGLNIIGIPPEHRKPSPETLRRILAENGLDSERTVFVGNNPVNDGGSTIGTGVRFVQSEFSIPTPDVEARLFALTGDRRLSYRGVRAELRRQDPRSKVVPFATLTRDLSQLISLLTSASQPATRT